MENILRFLSLKKEYRMAVVDMSQLSHKLLQDFNGSEEVKKFMEQVVTDCTLLVAIDNLEKKLSFSFRLNRGPHYLFSTKLPRNCSSLFGQSDSLSRLRSNVIRQKI